MPAIRLEPGSNQPGDTAVFGNGQKALVVTLINDDGSLPSGAGAASTTLGNAGYPQGATPISASSGNVANASAVATLAAAAGKRTYITGFEITAGGATAAALVAATLAGIAGGTATYIYGAPAGVAVQAAPLQVSFSQPIPSSAVNTALVLTLPALGAGNTNAAVVAHGFQL